MEGLAPYVHARHEGRRRVLRWMIDQIAFRFLIKFDHVEGLENLPPSGPAVLMINHIAFVDPIVVMGCLPRNVVPMAKIEAYRYPIIGIFPRLWDAIPVRRGEGDRAALRKALAVLAAGEAILVAPEGTRGPSLGRGHEGVAFLAARGRAPVIPTMIEGTDGFPSISPRRWRGPGAVVRLGRPFRFREAARPDKARLRLMTDEAMYALARGLPERRRGAYSDLRKASTSTIEFA
jgi:1-acyl-sn-glycerol-3-phosphate acyltransferase